MNEAIMNVLKQAADMKINLESETARKWLAETLKKSIYDWMERR